MALNNVHIHSLIIPGELEDIELSGTEIDQVLSPEEQIRYNRYLVKKKKVEFFLARKFTKKLLAERLQLSTTAIELIPEQSGKPYLLVNGQPALLHFNISHTSALIACAISECKHIGIDVENPTGPRDDLARRFFHPREVDNYLLLNKSDRNKRFYTLWTLKEAYSKATGKGLTIPLDSFWFSLTDAKGNKKIGIHFENQHPLATDGKYQFFLAQLPSGHILATAVRCSNRIEFIHHQYYLAENGDFKPCN